MIEFKSITYGDLFDYLEKYCNFHKRDTDDKTTWTCHGDLRATKKFCDKHRLFFPTVEKVLQSRGGYCDCEVLFNVADHIDVDKTIPKGL